MKKGKKSLTRKMKERLSKPSPNWAVYDHLGQLHRRGLSQYEAKTLARTIEGSFHNLNSKWITK